MQPIERKGAGHFTHLNPSDWQGGGMNPGYRITKPPALSSSPRERTCTAMSSKSQDSSSDNESRSTLTGEAWCSKRARQGSHSNDVAEGNDIRESLRVESSIEKDKKLVLPDPKVDCNPDDFVRQVMKAMYGIEPKVKKALDLGDYFPQITDEQIAAYDILVVSATRENDVQRLKMLHSDKEMSLECCNRFGETLLHMACRRGFRDIGEFLLDDVKVNVRVRDDCGRTPFHDVCWNPQPQLELAEALLRRDPTLLLISDKRGHTPFQYARPQDWPVWRQFVFDHRHHFKILLDAEPKEIFC